MTVTKKTAHTALMVGKSVLVGGNLAALRLLSRPRKLVRYVQENLLLYRSLTAEGGIRPKNVYEVLKPRVDMEQVVLGNLSDGDALFTLGPSFAIDIVSLCLICRILKPKRVFEIGTLNGYTSLHFALNTADDAVVFTLDLPKGQGVRPRLKTERADDKGIDLHARTNAYCFERSQVAPKIQTLFGDSAVFDFSPFHGTVDFFFVDGAHSYDYVRSDTINALKCCHPGSVIAWHDFGRVVVDGVAKWVTEFARDHEVYSVPGGSLAFTVLK